MTMSLYQHLVLCGLALTLATPITAFAEEQQGPIIGPVPIADAPASPLAPGDQTGSWLAIQRTGTMASANPQAASQDQRERAAARFLKTYDYAIKEAYFNTTSFKTGN
jgi:hypothetical protein